MSFVLSVFSQVLELEQQHSTALQELSQSYIAEKEQLIEQHQLQLQVRVEHVWRMTLVLGVLTSNVVPGELFLVESLSLALTTH